MYFDVTYKSKQFLFVLIKISIVVAAFYFIYYKITENEHLEFNSFMSFLKENDAFSIKTILFLVFLSSFNWFFEILKWQHLVKTVKHISFKSALEQSLGGLTASLITPNRIGDYGAKALYYEKPFRVQILWLNLLGNTAQMAITSILGLIGFLVFAHRYQMPINYLKIATVVVVLFFIGLLVFLGMKQKRFKIKGFSFSYILQFLKNIPIKTHGLNLVFSLIRYGIFSFQFYYILLLFGVDIEYTKAMILITSMYFLASIIPSISIFDVLIKGSVAVFLFGYIDVNELTILSVTTIMWILNFVIPSSFGSYFVLNFKLPKPVE